VNLFIAKVTTLAYDNIRHLANENELLFYLDIVVNLFLII